MKGLSFSQPWLWAVFDPTADKDIENRVGYQAPIDLIGKPIACHAAKSYDDDGLYKLLELGLSPPQECLKSAIVGVATIDRIVSSPKTLTATQRRWYMGDDSGMRDGKTVYGHVLVDRKLLPTPIPWDGQLGFWEVPPLIADEITHQLDGGQADLSGYKVPYSQALFDAGVQTASEWVAKHPGEHLWFKYPAGRSGAAFWPSCVACGKVRPNDDKKIKACKGVVHLTMRGE